jgi:hypothetical protein
MKKVQLLKEKMLVAKATSQPLNAGESTPKERSGDISNIMRLPYPPLIARAASSTVHQPGRLQ